RVSLTADSRHEVRTGFEILKNLGLRSKGPMTVSCPSCGRVEIDLVNIATEVERRLDDGYDEKITVAVMGCVVNGPGESMEADFGISGGKGKGLIYRQGELLRTVDESKLVESLFTEIDRAKDAGELAK
ncbi:MAG: flavodoxin-dependent (E)-4-hydroxy-3-methylbut-2-enyl-diphosphate synthase, partial [Candidatus Latescibacteria bacterium]|nr:flavodoxin-dependent (E)-4-hydroxy-3-methylbut-2-enyl-diphosphate synthase [Candidatus Latescibacterota bacterium]